MWRQREGCDGGGGGGGGGGGLDEGRLLFDQVLFYCFICSHKSNLHLSRINFVWLCNTVSVHGIPNMLKLEGLVI